MADKVKLPRLTRDFLINQFDITQEPWTHITREQAKKITEKMLQFARTNVKVIEKAKLYSPAYEVYKNSGGTLSLPKKNSRASQILELARLQQFLQSQTATVKGIREINRQQDIRLFGQTAKGNPRKRMTLEQRKAYWAAYNEFINSDLYKQYRFYNSNVIQQAILVIGLDKRRFSAGDLEEIPNLLQDLQNAYEESEGQSDFLDEVKRNYSNYAKYRNYKKLHPDDKFDWSSVANVYTGRRNRKS